MQTTTTLLSIIRKRGQRGLPLCNVYRMLYNQNLYLTAYGKLYRSFDVDKFRRLIRDI